MQPTAFQKLRMRLYLVVVGIYKRMTLGARAVVMREGRVLLIRHAYVNGWHLPGGGVDPGETAQDAARREVIEETGFRPEGAGRLVGLYLSRAASNRDHVALYRFDGAVEARAFRPTLEIAEIGWFAVDALPPDTTEATRRRIAEAMGDAPPPAEW